MITKLNNLYGYRVKQSHENPFNFVYIAHAVRTVKVTQTHNIVITNSSKNIH